MIRRSSRHQEQLAANIDELPDAAGCDAAFVALISEDGATFENVFAASTGFARRVQAIQRRDAQKTRIGTRFLEKVLGFWMN